MASWDIPVLKNDGQLPVTIVVMDELPQQTNIRRKRNTGRRLIDETFCSEYVM
jgi:hypothetical protein